MKQKETISLYEKIQNVSNAIGNLEKDMTIGKGNYAYKAVSDLKVTLAVKEAETANRIISIPIKQELISSETIRVLKKGDETIKFSENIKMTVRIIDLDNTDMFLDVEAFGKGLDPGDKGFGKASTYARKYALLNAYKIATGEDPDNEKSVDEKTPKTISEKRIAVENYLDLNISAKTEMLKHFSVSDLSDISEKDIQLIYTTYRKKKLI